MTDTVAIEAPVEPVPSVLPAPELADEVDAVLPDAAPAEAAATEAPDETPAPQADAPAATPELGYSNGSTSDLILDHFIDSAESGDQSMNQIKAAFPHVDPNTIESAVRRLFSIWVE
jgi:hypothetical protein